MPTVAKSDTLTITNIVAAYRSAYFSVYGEPPHECEYVGDGMFYVNGKELQRIELLNAIRDLRYQALQLAEDKVQHDSIRGRLFRLIKRLRHNPELESPNRTTASAAYAHEPQSEARETLAKSNANEGLDTVRFNKAEISALRRAAAVNQTKPLDQNYTPPTDTFIPRGQSEETALTDSNMLVISIENVRMRVPIVSKVFFGRDMAEMGSTKVFDLTSFGGLRKGISRRHAEITLTADNHLELIDLGSTNGTYLNYKKLKPLQPQRIHDGDHIRMGKISIEIYFEHG